LKGQALTVDNLERQAEAKDNKAHTAGDAVSAFARRHPYQSARKFACTRWRSIKDNLRL
jgi:hypothetical protein